MRIQFKITDSNVLSVSGIGLTSIYWSLIVRSERDASSKLQDLVVNQAADLVQYKHQLEDQRQHSTESISY